MTATPGRREPTFDEMAAHASGVEMEALASIVAAFERMPAEAHARTLRYLADRYGDRLAKAMRPPIAVRPSERTAG